MTDDLIERAAREVRTIAGEHAPEGARLAHVVTACLIDLGDGRSMVVTSNVAAGSPSPDARARIGLEVLSAASDFIRQHPSGRIDPI